MILDVLAVADVGAAAGELARDVPENAQRPGVEGLAVGAHAEHEVLVLELLRLQGGGAPTVDAGFALGVEAPPAKAPPQVLGRDRVEALLGVDRLDPLSHLQWGPFGLEDLVAVERLVTVHGPLAVAATLTGAAQRALRSGGGKRHGRTPG